VTSHLGQRSGVSSQRWKEPVVSLRTGSVPERMAAMRRFMAWKRVALGLSVGFVSWRIRVGEGYSIGRSAGA